MLSLTHVARTHTHTHVQTAKYTFFKPRSVSVPFATLVARSKPKPILTHIHLYMPYFVAAAVVVGGVFSLRERIQI